MSAVATLSRPQRQCFDRGDIVGLIEAFGADDNPSALARFVIELRRENVATLGDHEAFVRHTSEGELRQVIRPVRLSVHDGTLYRIGGGVRNRPLVASSIKRDEDGKLIAYDVVPPTWKLGNENRAGGWKEWQHDHRGVDAVVWEEVELPARGPAMLTFEGFSRVNSVVGASIVPLPTVVVDGEKKTNPYVQRSESRGGGLGDVQRIVTAVGVVALSPITGNPVVVHYTLDYDPAKEFAHMLARIEGDHPNDCYLITEEEASHLRESEPQEFRRWKYHPLYGGVGYFFDLRLDKVRRAYAEFIQLLAFAQRKANTVALRNAMKRHPAFSIHHVETRSNGTATIPVVGWAMQGDAHQRVQRLADRLKVGGTEAALAEVEAGAEIIDVTAANTNEGQVVERAADGAETLEADEDADQRATRALDAPREEFGGNLLDQVAKLGQHEPTVTSAVEGTAAAEAIKARVSAPVPKLNPAPVKGERDTLIEFIESALELVTLTQQEGLGYEPDTMDIAELRAVKVKINTMLDGANR